MAVQEKHANQYQVSVDENEKPPLRICSKLKDPTFRSKLFRWMALPCAMFTLGVAVSQGGPTLLDLRIITGVDEETASFFFTSISGGYLVGSFVAAGIHGKISNSLVMTVVTLIAGGMTIATPYCSIFTQMLCIRAIVGFFLATIDCSINAEHMYIWGTEGQALLQSVHFAFAIGGVIGPAFSAPFLTEEKDKDEMTTQHYLNVTYSYLNVTQNPVVNHTDATNSTLPQTTEVHYAYLIAGIILMLASVPFLVMLIFCNKPKADEEKYAESQQRKLPKSIYTFLCAVLCAYYVMYCCIENSFSSFLETFLVDEFKLTKAHAAYITSYYWAAFAAGRFTAIFTSKFVVAVRLLYIQFCILIVAIIGFVLGSHYSSIDAVTAFTCLIGVGCSSMHPLGFSWTEAEIMKVTGIITGVIMVGLSIGSMICAYLIGYLMQNVSKMWFCYYLAGGLGLTILLFLFMLFFNRLYVNRQYGKFDQITKQEQEVKSSSKHMQSGF